MSANKLQFIDSKGQPLMAAAHYAADTTVKEFTNWNPTLSDPDTELEYERDNLVARSRDLTRNNGVASGLAQTYEDSIVGTQFRLSARPDYVALGKTKKWADKWAKSTEAKWRLYAESVECDAARLHNFHGLTKQVLNEGLTGSEALALPLWFKSRKVHTVFQLVDADRLSTPDGQLNSKNMRNGVQISKYNEAVAYHIRKAHPGQAFSGFSTADDLAWVRVPARTRFGRRRVLHVYDPKRIGQHRGKPSLTAMMGDFKQLDHYQKFELKAAIANSMIAAFIETGIDSQGIADLFNGDMKEYADGRNEWHANLTGGAVIPLFPGDKLNAFTPSRPATAYAEYVESMFRNISAGANVPYELLMKDFSKTNYSSARAAILEGWRFFMGRRKWLSDFWATPAYELWLEELVNAGEIEAEGFYEFKTAYTRCRWIGGGRGWVDEEKEAKSAVMRMKANLSTLEEENAAQGKDWEETIEQRAVEDIRVMENQALVLEAKKKLEEKHDVVLDTPSFEGVPAPSPRGAEDDSEEDEGSTGTGKLDDPEKKQVADGAN